MGIYQKIKGIFPSKRSKDIYYDFQLKRFRDRHTGKFVSKNGEKKESKVYHLYGVKPE